MISLILRRLIVTIGVVAMPTMASCEETTIKVGWCVKSYNDGIAPIAVATRMGWFAQMGIKVEIVPIAGSNDCVRFIGTRDILFAIPSVEPVALFRATGLKTKVFYTAYQGNIYGIAVPVDSPIKNVAGLKGKKIGVNSMASASGVLARAALANAGLDPNRDATFVVAGEGAQALALLKSQQVDALSQYDMQYAFLGNAGAPMRILPTPETEHFPGNGFVALDETLKSRRKEAIALARGYAMGTIYSIHNPAGAIKMLWQEYPQSKPAAKDESKALADEVSILQARIANWKLEKGGVVRWGESSLPNYQNYFDFLLKQDVLKTSVKAAEIVDNDLVPDINAFDADAVIRQAEEVPAN